MDYSEEISKKQQIIPVTGKITERFFGEDVVREKLEKVDQVTYDLCRLFDGLAATISQYETFPVRGFLQAVAKGTVFDGPSVGLKIHLTLPWNNSSFIEILEKIAVLCSMPNTDGKSTTFKVMFPGSQESALRGGNLLQGIKTITILPNYIYGEKTNVRETVRLVDGLRKIMSEANLQLSEIESNIAKSERNSGEGIYIRPGQFTQEGYQYEMAGRDATFEEQLANLNSPETDEELFRKQIGEAIESGKL